MWMFSGQAKGKNLMKSSESEIRAQPTKILQRRRGILWDSFHAMFLCRMGDTLQTGFDGAVDLDSDHVSKNESCSLKANYNPAATKESSQMMGFRTRWYLKVDIIKLISTGVASFATINGSNSSILV
jgi:hypothetical protein